MRTRAWCGAAWAALALAWSGCVATPVPIPPSADPDRIEVFGDEQRTVIRGESGAISGTTQGLRASSASGSAEGGAQDDGSFNLVVPGLPSDVFYLEGLLPTEDRFLLALTAGPMGRAATADPGGDADGDGSPDAVDCAPMDPMLSGSRCPALCDPERCDDMRDNDCDAVVDEGCAGSGCANDAECAPGNRCAMGSCVTIPCMSSAECPAGFLCPSPGGSCAPVGTDGDGDGYPVPLDCADGDPAVHPGAPELCDMRDNDCDDVVDEMCGGAGCMTDADCPTGSVCNAMSTCQSMSCMADSDCPMGSVCNAGACGALRRDADMDGASPPADCNDMDPTVRPGAPELCNMVDDNCDGRLDEGCMMSSCMTDAECPFTFRCAGGACVRIACMTAMECPMGADCVGFECQPTMGLDGDMDMFSPPADCNDMDPLIFPMAPERCNMQDDDCDGPIDEGCM